MYLPGCGPGDRALLPEQIERILMGCGCAQRAKKAREARQARLAQIAEAKAKRQAEAQKQATQQA